MLSALLPQKNCVSHLGYELVRVWVPVVLECEVGGDGGHRYPDVGVLDGVALREVVHDGLRLDMRKQQQRANNNSSNSNATKTWVKNRLGDTDDERVWCTCFLFFGAPYDGIALCEVFRVASPKFCEAGHETRQR